MSDNYDNEINELKLQHQQTQTQLIQHQLEYTKRHGELSERVARVEVLLPSLVTKDDLASMKNDLLTFWNTKVEGQLTSSTELKIDVDWLKKWFWALIGFCLGLASGLVGHLFGKI